MRGGSAAVRMWVSQEVFENGALLTEPGVYL